MHKLDAEQIRQQITALQLECPELAEDDVLRADMVEAETDAHEFLRQLLRERSLTLAMMDALASTVFEFNARRGRFERREAALCKLMHKILDAADLKKWELPEGTLGIRKGVPKVIIFEPKDIPEGYLRVTVEPDKTLIGAALKAGANVPGATLSNAEPTLSIRIR